MRFAKQPSLLGWFAKPRVVWAFAAWLILSGHGRAEEARLPDAVAIFQCAFGTDWDMNYDAWPDRWVRKTGTGLPHYVNIAIEDDETAAEKKCLQINLDGASAEVESPPIRVLPRFSYLFEAKLKVSNLKYSTATIALNFCDAKGRVLQTAKSESLSSTNGWHTIQLGPVEPRHPSITRVVMSLTAQRGSKGDLRGQVCLSDVRLSRRPRIDVSMNSACNVYTQLDGVDVNCVLSGIREQHPEVDFQLLDEANKELQREHFRLDGTSIDDDPGSAASGANSVKPPGQFECRKTWQPKIPDYGFYRVVVLMKSAEANGGGADAEHPMASRTVDFVVAPPLAMPRRGNFGWTLPEADRPLSFQDLSRLLPEVGINWVKVPLWFDASQPRRGDEIIRFVELLGASNIDVVGIIDRPPTLAKGAGRGHVATIADWLSQDSTNWAAALEPVMTRLSLRVRWWQLGSDFDTSFSGLKSLKKRIADLRTAIFRYGQDVRLGMSWDWAGANSHKGDVSWEFEQFCTDKQPSDAKFAEFLALPHGNSARRWVMVEPPPLAASDKGSQAPAEPRATEFVKRIIMAKVSGADSIFVARPFHDEVGLMRTNGMPTELLLPWRTTAAMLGGAQYMGQMQLPGGSENRIFLRGDGQVVMVLWNSAPTREMLYLGEKVQQIDLLGRTKAAEMQGKEQVIQVGPTPSFVLGLHEAVTRWRMSAEFARKQIPSIFSKPHHNELRFKNYFPQGVGGTAKIVILQDRASTEVAEQEGNAAPGYTTDRWTIEPPQTSFRLAMNAEAKFPCDVQLKRVWYGKKPVRIDFTVEAEEKFEFSIYRYLEVGTEDLSLDVKSHLDKDGTLIVEQTMTNSAPQTADFKCSLRARGHRPQRVQVYRLGKNPDRRVYRMDDGANLIGEELWLELEELNGPRTLMYRFVAGEDTDKPSEGNAPLKGSKVDATPPVAPDSDNPQPLAKAKS